MGTIIFENANVWDGNSDQCYRADVLVSGNRIESISRGAAGFSGIDAQRIDARGGTLMPGLVDAHSHVSFPPVTSATSTLDTPPEETLLETMYNARTLLDAGFTTLVGAGSPRIRTEAVIRNEINRGRIPGPRLYASSPTLTVTGGLNDERSLHELRTPTGLIVDGADDCRRAVRLCYREGVDIIKVNVSGDDYFPRPPGNTTPMSEEELRVITATARALDLYVVAHARSAESVKMSVRCGVDLIHHCDFADEEALDMLEEARDRVIVTPTIGYLHALMYEAEAFGFNAEVRQGMKLEHHLECNIVTHRELRKRDLRAGIGGDYGLPMLPHGAQARDIEHMINYFGYTPVEALRCATQYGGQILHRGHELGLVRENYLADLLLVKGDPLQDVTLLQNSNNLLAIMKDGQWHKQPQ